MKTQSALSTLLANLLANLLATVVLTTAFAAGFASSASAEEGKVSSILYTCNLSFKATGSSIYLGIGYTDIGGSGEISCYDLLTGATQHLPVKVRARGPGVGLGVTGLALSGAATGVGVSKGPESLLGRYVMARGNAAVGIGAAAGAGLRISKGSVTVDVSVQAQSGLGAGVDLLWIDLESGGVATTEPAKSLPPLESAKLAAVPTAQPASVVQKAPIRLSTSKTIYLSEGQPLEIVDGQGRVIQTIYLKPTRQ